MESSLDSLSKQAARAAYGWGREQSWDDALDLLRRAAEANEPGAGRQLELVTQAPIEQLLEPPEADLLSNVAQIGACRGFAPPGFSEWLIDCAKDRLDPASTYDADGGQSARTARVFGFSPRTSDVVLAIMQERAARLTRVPARFHEPPNVISYEAGEEFKLHVDFFDPQLQQYQEILRVLGQRIATIVTYLNDDFEGAETWFPDAEVKFRGATGDAIVFSNVLPDGNPDLNTRHAGLPPSRGRKWVLSQWIRNKPHLYRPEDLL